MEYKTDKIEHGLISEYEVLLDEYKNKEITVLEIGIRRGGSIMWMADYFKNAKIIGGDLRTPLNKEEILEYSNRISLCSLDQGVPDTLVETAKIYGKFDIIIDDGCHRAKETKITFDTLWSTLNKGGLYIIEDFIAGYWENKPHWKGINNLVADIMIDKNKLGIRNFGIILKEPKCSYAYFEKI